MLKSRLCAVVVMLLVAGCRRAESRSTPADHTPLDGRAQIASSASAAPIATRPFVSAHPRAAWRLANSAELDPVVLWVSHIVVRHSASRAEVSFSPAYWFSVQPAVTRSREEALTLALTIAEQAKRTPHEFAALAREYSEDLGSRAEGGALGGVQASQLEPWPRVLDALAAIRPGQTSDVVETPYGFHILHRSAPCAEARLSGAHIVIGHDQAKWLDVFARGQRPGRSRDEALALATEVFMKAKTAPTRFAELVQQYSEHHDAVIDGDFGAWSTREPVDFPPRMKRLRELEVGEVGAPIETHLGFEIIVRTAPRQRERYRARLAIFPVEKADMDSPRVDAAASQAALARANLLADACSHGSACFETNVSQVGESEWEEGRRFATLSAELKHLRPNQVTPTPVASEDGYIVAQRLPTKGEPVTTWKTELPTPTEADTLHFFTSLSNTDATGFLKEFAAHVVTDLALPSPKAEGLRKVHDIAGRASSDSSAQAQRALFEGVQAATRELLGDVTYARYRSALNRAVVATLLRGPADPHEELGL